MKEEDDEYDIEIKEKKRKGEDACPPVLSEQIHAEENSNAPLVSQ